MRVVVSGGHDNDDVECPSRGVGRGLDQSVPAPAAVTVPGMGGVLWVMGVMPPSN